MTSAAQCVTTIVTAMTDAERPFLPKALASVLAQGPANHVLVFMREDCSWIDEIERAFPSVQIVRGPLRPISVIRNTGIRLARTEWIAFLDGDDVWCAGKLDAQLADARRTGSDFVGCDHVMIDSADRPFAFGLCLNYPLPSGWLVRRAHLVAAPFDETLSDNTEDWVWFQTVGRTFRSSRSPKVMLQYRVRRKSLSSWERFKRRKERILALSEFPGIRFVTLWGSAMLRAVFRKQTYRTVPGFNG
jgi:glycosyltransferase involved in cell wall biosynthesis